MLDEACRISRAEGASTFEIDTGKKVYYLTVELERQHGRLDSGAAECAAPERHQVAVESRRSEALRAGLGDEGEERPREEVLVCAAGKDVPLLQGAQ